MQHRFRTLDGIRGVAALLVVVLHGQPILHTRLFEHGYLMVDLFFLMSGFVLSAGYGARLQAGGAGAWFARRRFLRLYPLAMVGMAMGGAAELFGLAHATLSPLPQWPLMAALSVSFLPWLGGGLIAPFDGPTWSLQLEFWINALYGAVAPRLSNRRLAWVVATCGFALVAASLSRGQFDGGFANDDPSRQAGSLAFLVGWARTGFSFPLGILLHRLWQAGRVKVGASRAAGWIVPVGLTLVAIAPPVATPLFDLAIVGGVFPALLMLAVDNEPSGSLAGIYDRLGRLSFGLYALHGPILVFLHGLEPVQAGVVLRLALFSLGLAASLLAAAVAERWIDAPIRRYIRRNESMIQGATASASPV